MNGTRGLVWGSSTPPSNLECGACAHFRYGQARPGVGWYRCTRFWPLRNAPFENSPCRYVVEKKR